MTNKNIDFQGNDLIIALKEKYIYACSYIDCEKSKNWKDLTYEKIKSDPNVYKIFLNSRNAFILRYLLKNMSVLIDKKDALVLSKYANSAPKPEAKLSEDLKKIELTIPNVKYYIDIAQSVGGYKTKQGWNIPLTRIIDFEELVNTSKTFFPRIKMQEELKRFNNEKLKGFDGTLNSLKRIPIGALNIISANSQNKKSLKKSQKTLEEKLFNFGIKNLYDLLFWIPRTYIDKSKPQNIDDLIDGESATIVGTIKNISTIANGNGIVFIIKTGDKRNIRTTFFRQRWLQSQFHVDDTVLITGKFSTWNGKPQLTGTSIEHSEEASILPIVPVYKQSETRGINTKIILSAVRELFSRIDDIKLPEYILQKTKISYFNALKEMHFPTDKETFKYAKNVLAYYELIYMQIILQKEKLEESTAKGISQVKTQKDYQNKMIKLLPFSLTNSQNKAVIKLNESLEKNVPSSTLLNADVGAGKGLLENEKILTKNGWVKILDLRVGDRIIGKNAEETLVTGVFPQGEQEVAKIIFDDGSFIITDLNHLWTTKEKGVISTKQILNLKRISLTIPLIEKPVEYNNKYIISTPYLTTQKIINHSSGIPNEFLYFNSNDRISVLQAILDIIGYVENGKTFISNTKKKITKQVIELVQSLGGITKIRKNQIEICLPRNIQPFKFKKHIKFSNFSRKIIKVEKLKRKERTICIKVDAKDELFVTKDFIVTHNTIVGELAALRSVENGHQAVIVGPTEILAQQLFNSFKNIVETLNQHGEKLVIGFLGGSTKIREKKKILEDVKNGGINILVGTHAVLSSDVEYNDLGFICIDEQQKFGAEQRSSLLKSRKDDKVPDILLQTATPIPRSTAQVFYGDIDMIMMDEKPPGRLPIKTLWIEKNPEEIIQEVTNPIWTDVINEANNGNQTFIIAPLVEDSEKIDAASVEKTYNEISKKALRDIRVGFVHGKMKKEESEKIMSDFRDKKLDVLVSSTVVEVGVDIHDATRIIILSADRLGASSLHQLRGRVGRNSKKSVCYLISAGKTESSRKRLQSLVNSGNGFYIAKADLLLRGEGKIFGTKQSGESDMHFANIAHSSKMIQKSKEIAKNILLSENSNKAIEDAEIIFNVDNVLY